MSNSEEDDEKVQGKWFRRALVGLCRERLANYSTYYIVENERKDILDQYEEAPQLYSKNSANTSINQAEMYHLSTITASISASSNCRSLGFQNLDSPGASQK